MEIWKDVLGYEGIYMVSDCGRIKSLARDIVISPSASGRQKGYTRSQPEIIMSTFFNNNGYECATLYKGGARTKRHQLVHRIVYEAFNGKILSGEIDHINKNRKDNRLCNIRNVTKSENCQRISHKLGISGFKNVCHDKQRNNYFFTKMINRKKYFIYSFENPRDAYEAGQELLKRIHC